MSTLLGIGVLVILGLLAALGIYVMKTSDDFMVLGAITCLLFLFALTMALIALGLGQAVGRGNVAQYYATKVTIEDARKNNPSEIERAALTKTIIEINQKLANDKYWNSNPWFDIYIYDGWAELPPLK